MVVKIECKYPTCFLVVGLEGEENEKSHHTY